MERELFGSHTPTESGNDPNNKSYHLIHNEPVEDTPFRVVGNEERGYFLTWGKYRISEPQPTLQKAKDDVSKWQNWNMVLTCCMAVAMQVIEERLITAPGTTIK